MVGEWVLTQESLVTGDERTLTENVLTFRAALSVAKARWNFLRSQPIEQADGHGDIGDSAMATLSPAELEECAARCAVDTYEQLIMTFLPSHNRYAMTMADAVRSFLATLLWERSPELSMWEATLITAERFDFDRLVRGPSARPASHLTASQFRLWCDCWKRIVLVDVHHFPLWERAVHDTLLLDFAPLVRIFAHYCKGVSGVDSAADAFEMELEEFHDLVKDARLETRLVPWALMSGVFGKADAENVLDVFERHQASRRHPQVLVEQRIQKAKQEEAERHRAGLDKYYVRGGSAAWAVVRAHAAVRSSPRAAARPAARRAAGST